MSKAQGPESDSSEKGGVDVAALFRVVFQQWKAVLVVTLVIAACTGAWLARQTPLYLAATILKIDPHAIRPLGRDVQTPGDSTDFYWTNKEYYETQYKIIASRKVGERVVQLLGLHRDQGFLRQLPPGDRSSDALPAVTVTEAAQLLRSRMTVEPDEKSRLVTVTFEDSDPARAQRVINAIAEVYIEQNLDTSLANIGSAADWLNDQLGKLKTELESSEIALHEYKKEKRLLSVSLDDRTNMLRNEMEQLHQALTEVRTTREKLASRVAQLNTVDARDPSNVPSSELLQSETLGGLREAYLEARTELEKLQGSGKGDAHPEVKRAMAATASRRAALISEIENIKGAFEKDLRAIDQEIGGITGLYKRAEQQAFDLNLLEIEYKRLARANENTERLHAIVLERAKESELGGQMRFNNVDVVDAALLPRAPHKPRVGLVMSGGVVLGFLLGMALVLLRQKVRQRIETPEELEEQLGTTCLGIIPEIPVERTGSRFSGLGNRLSRPSPSAPPPGGGPPELYVHRNSTSAAAEAVRALRTNLLFMSPDNPYSRILITSAGPTDGKTTMAVFLASTLAHSGQRVLLIDADLRRPRLSAALGVVHSLKGVTTAVLDPESLRGAIQSTEVENLSLLPTGPLPPNPAELLHSKRFQKLLELASGMFDKVIVDSPPLTPVTDAAILSTCVDATILVVRSGETRRERAQQALRALSDVNATVAGAVLNGVKKATGGGYYYRYGTYGSQSERPPATQA